MKAIKVKTVAGHKRSADAMFLPKCLLLIKVTERKRKSNRTAASQTCVCPQCCSWWWSVDVFVGGVGAGWCVMVVWDRSEAVRQCCSVNEGTIIRRVRKQVGRARTDENERCRSKCCAKSAQFKRGVDCADGSKLPLFFIRWCRYEYLSVVRFLPFPWLPVVVNGHRRRTRSIHLAQHSKRRFLVTFLLGKKDDKKGVLIG